MTLAIVYTSRYGTTRRIAETVAARCRDQFDNVVLHEVGRNGELPEADVVLIGAPIYAGSIPRAMRSYVEANANALLERRVGLYLSCFYDGHRAEQQLADNFPPRLVAHSFGAYYPGGDVKFSRLRWLDRTIMKRVAGVSADVERTNQSELDRLVHDLGVFAA